MKWLHFIVLPSYYTPAYQLCLQHILLPSQSQGEGQTLANFICTICAQVALVLCEPLQVVALKTKVY